MLYCSGLLKSLSSFCLGNRSFSWLLQYMLSRTVSFPGLHLQLPNLGCKPPNNHLPAAKKNTKNELEFCSQDKITFLQPMMPKKGPATPKVLHYCLTSVVDSTSHNHTKDCNMHKMSYHKFCYLYLLSLALGHLYLVQIFV